MPLSAMLRAVPVQVHPVRELIMSQTANGHFQSTLSISHGFSTPVWLKVSSKPENTASIDFGTYTLRPGYPYLVGPGGVMVLTVFAGTANLAEIDVEFASSSNASQTPRFGLAVQVPCAYPHRNKKRDLLGVQSDERKKKEKEVEGSGTKEGRTEGAANEGTEQLIKELYKMRIPGVRKQAATVEKTAELEQVEWKMGMEQSGLPKMIELQSIELGECLVLSGFAIADGSTQLCVHSPIDLEADPLHEAILIVQQFLTTAENHGYPAKYALKGKNSADASKILHCFRAEWVQTIIDYTAKQFILEGELVVKFRAGVFKQLEASLNHLNHRQRKIECNTMKNENGSESSSDILPINLQRNPDWKWRE